MRTATKHTMRMTSLGMLSLLLVTCPLSFGGEETKVRVRMAVYNVACGQWTTPEKVARELKRHDLDILGLNEMPRLIEGKAGEEWCERLAQALKMPHVYTGVISSANHGAPKWVDESGNYEGKYKAVLSRTPLFDTREFKLTGGNWNPASAVRAVTVVRGVRFAFYSLHVNTHWRDLEKVFREDKEFHVFGGGDYNHSNYPEFDKAANMRDGRWEVAGKKSIDRIFYRPNGKVKCVFNDVIRPKPKMSDHPYATSVFEFDSDRPGDSLEQLSAESIISRHKNTTDKPPAFGHYMKWSTDALLMGNGDMGLSVGGLGGPNSQPFMEVPRCSVSWT